MAACNFKIPFTGSSEEVFRKAQKAVQSQNGNFTGDNNNGEFEVTVFGNTIAGTYTFVGNEMDVVITSKPFLLSCGMIENYLKSQIG
jgi:hypothetical protein